MTKYSLLSRINPQVDLEVTRESQTPNHASGPSASAAKWHTEQPLYEYRGLSSGELGKVSHASLGDALIIPAEHLQSSLLESRASGVQPSVPHIPLCTSHKTGGEGICTDRATPVCWALLCSPEELHGPKLGSFHIFICFILSGSCF